MKKFKDDLLRLSAQVAERREHITNEEMTKHSLIIPFLQVLDYDVFNPLEIRPEYIADFGKKKGEKVDYAVFKNGIPIIFIEAKAVNESIQNHSAQLARYFNATPEVRIAIITNGIEYRFFTDLDKNNIMDETSFHKFDITNITDSEIEILSNFRKDSFETEAIIKHAEELTYTTNLNKKLREIFKNPPDEFVRYLIKEFSDTKITSNVIERFRPIVKKSISQALLELVSQSLQNGNDSDINEQEYLQDGEEKPKKDIITTEEELNCFNTIKNILESSNLDVSEIDYKDTISYFGVHYKHTHNWFVRLSMGTNKTIIIRLPLQKAKEHEVPFNIETAPKGHGESIRIAITSKEDLNKLKDIIIESYKSVLNG